MEYELLLKALEEFIISDNPAVWSGKVQPLLAKLVQSSAYGTCRNAILRQTGLFITDTAGRNVILTATELQALRMAKNAAARAAIWKQILASVGWTAPYVFAAIVILTTAKDGHALAQIVSPSNQNAYQEYFNRYLGYVIRTAEIGKNLNRLPPPMNYEKWLNRDTSLAWWQG